ncbi:MAG: hypothetical protein AAB903_03995 [Patescibacteria group bacterium]
MFKKPIHYYGDTVRRLFVLAALVMVVTLPFFVKQIEQPLIVTIGAILIIGVAAGLTSPRNPWTAMFNILVAVGGVIAFEWRAVEWYARSGDADSFFWITQLLAVIFLLALYFGLKTMRRVGSMELLAGSYESEKSFWDRPPRDDGGDDGS